uniref:Actin cross-linking n=1 Tax=Kwoniella bestiolae CBS 10118 TaxID=1296100 RepID=A0A1B9FSR3_9TREE|nr:actin cross-linking [Kwoniella bestiolae CBS 10118]OCF21817.1 actin cross-linking [Kwoniella bestiolae CBS 10118]
MAPSKFGASKYRNSISSIPPREEFYRSHLPSQNSSSSSNLSTFSGEVKSNREWIVTVTAAGDLSYRKYGTYTGEEAGVEKVGKGGGIGDWDLSRLEDDTVVIGGLDGTISVYDLTEGPSFTLRHTIPGLSSSPITNLSLHSTTPNLLLVSSVSHPLVIYDTSASASPAITLNLKEPKGIWSFGWSGDGTKVAVIDKSGNLYIYEPRQSNDPIKTKNLSFSIQALKPCRLTWIGEDIFVTSFSKTRNRQYSLISTTKNPNELETIFTQSLDTSTNPLVPLVDDERRIIYLVGKGDMTLRQIELSGPMGYQETLHPLQYTLNNGSIAMVHPTKLDVMKAEIASVLLQVTDKDGDALVPLSAKVPRRQLIDYHEDLYPDVVGSIPEQTNQEWLNGADKKPLYFSLDPSRRSTWEGRIKEYKETSAKSKPSASISTAQSAPAPMVSAPKQALPTATTPPSTISSDEPSVDNGKPRDNLASASSTKTNTNLPSLENGETYSSTSYKSRIVADYLAGEYERHKQGNSSGPLMAGLQGPQGCGKTTLCSGFVEYLKEKKGLSAAVLSLDDLYKTHDGLKMVAAKHPDNALLAGRGPPGTHDVDLAKSVIEKVKQINDFPANTVDFPIFDKSLCGGEGDRSAESVKINGPIDVFILEGWSMGFAPLSSSELDSAYSTPKPASPQTSDTYFVKHPISSLQTLNSYLSEFSQAVYQSFQAFVQVEPLSYNYVFKWRLQQEHGMKANNGGKGMTDEQVHKFVERYMPGYELWKEGIWNAGTGWEGRGLKLVFGSEREVVDVVQPTSAEKKPETPTKSSERDLPVQVEKPKEVEITPFPPATNATKQPKLQDTIANAVSPTPSKTQPLEASTPSTALSKPAERYNPNWSRKFLAGKSPLIPTYDSLPPLSSLHQDSKILKANAHLAFFPIQGTGGRLNVHPLAKKGRLSVGGEGYLSAGVEIVDFDVELAGDRVAVACEDGLVRVWKVGKEGLQGVGPEPDQVLRGEFDKITQIAFHPTAQDLLVALTNDHGSSHIRFWDLSGGEEVKVVEASSKGTFNFIFSSEGDRAALATKDNQILVLDPRDPSAVVSGKSHDSPRSFQISWIDDAHLVSVGFSRGSQRKINLYRITSGSIEVIESITIDVSPSVLFPVYDPDTSILYIWGKGERVIQAYEISLNNQGDKVNKLPSFTAPSPQLGLVFMPKRMVDVKKVEVARALRLTGKTLEEVAFSIPRNKPAFFQDDIYIPTNDVEKYVMSTSEWLEGKNISPKKIDLNPEGMIPLSQAPKTDTSAAKKFVPAANVMSEEEKKRREMDALFAKAKMDESSDEEEEEVKGLAPPDDDW